MTVWVRAYMANAVAHADPQVDARTHDVYGKRYALWADGVLHVACGRTLWEAPFRDRRLGVAPPGPEVKRCAKCERYVNAGKRVQHSERPLV